ncbi:hypothetical protein C0993_008539 [Termitomyces sp. T159_Od127]|nr:hypothetical protein C0993_008539 [Termitomyces sp. T159_Od127]
MLTITSGHGFGGTPDVIFPTFSLKEVSFLKTPRYFLMVSVLTDTGGIIVSLFGTTRSLDALTHGADQLKHWRDVPLLRAISLGVASVEADVWNVDGQLLVGHETAALTANRTFDSLYIQPLLEILAGQNPTDEFNMNVTTPNGVFDTSSGTPLQLLVDMKTDGVQYASGIHENCVLKRLLMHRTLPLVLAALQPLRNANYLTTAVQGILHIGAVTVVGTGNTPLEGIQALEPRDMFFDAPLNALNDSSINAVWNASLAPIASVDYEAVVGWNGIQNITEEQRSAIITLVESAHSFGIKARFWDTPAWPIQARDNVWRELLDDGADWLNADDLEAASKF